MSDKKAVGQKSITNAAGMERYCRSKEILLVIKYFVGMAHAGEKV